MGQAPPNGGQFNHADIAAIVAAAVQATRQDVPVPEPRPARVPRQLEWPEIKQLYSKGKDFRAWYHGYVEQARHVQAELRSLHLLTAVEPMIRRSCEAHFTGQGRAMNTVSEAQLVDYITTTFVPTDVVFRRILKYLFDTEQSKGATCADYLRLRTERSAALALDGIHLPEAIERTLMVNGMKEDVRAQLKRRTDWWTVPLDELRRRAIQESKAVEESRKRPDKKPDSQHLYAAVGRPRLSGDRSEPAGNGTVQPETLASATGQRTHGQKRGDMGRGKSRIPLSAMKPLYTEKEWEQRNKRAADGAYLPSTAPDRRHLYSKDVHPQTRKPFCVFCQEEGHTLATCRKVEGARVSRTKRGYSSKGAGRSSKQRRRN